MATKKPSTGEKQVRGRDGRFMKGNRSGGRKEIPTDIKEMLRSATPDACRLLVETINDVEAKPELRIKCCEIVLDRVYGKPQQSVDLDAKNIPQVVFVGGDDIAD